MPKIDDLVNWLGEFDQSEQDKPVTLGTWSIPASAVIAQTLKWAFPRGESDTFSGKELVAGQLVYLKAHAKISNPEEAANYIVEDLLLPMKNKGKLSIKEGLDPLADVNRSPTFAGQVLNRDGRRCVITRQCDRSLPKADSDTNRVHLEAAHIFPSSLASLDGRIILITCFVANRAQAILSSEAVHEPWNGLAMQHDVHQDFDNYLFGLKCVAPNIYEVEQINMEVPGLSFEVLNKTIDLSRKDKTGNPGASLIQLHYHMAQLFEALRLCKLN